jgi:uncharacterized protein (TIGR00661 family)
MKGRGGSLRALFVVQGEGRGHLTQAIALADQWRESGHEVCGLFLGGEGGRLLPDYFAKRIGLEPIRFASPITRAGALRRGVSAAQTLTFNASRIPQYARSVRELRAAAAELHPDLVVNFYDSVAGRAFSGKRGSPPLVSIGHHYLLGHPGASSYPRGKLLGASVPFMNRLSAPPGVTRIALSLRPHPDGPTPHTRVVPPLLRKEVLEMRPEDGGHLLVYLLHPGYAQAVARWHARNRGVVIHGFWDRPGAARSEELHPNLILHRLDDSRFLELLRTCRGFVGTAGFESVAEALWLGKPAMVVPTGNHTVQAWDAREAVAAGAGISRSDFDLSPFLDYLPNHRPRTEEFRGWVEKGSGRILEILEEAARRG